MHLILRYGFGNAGNATYGIPGGATLEYKIKLNAFEKVRKSNQINWSIFLRAADVKMYCVVYIFVF